MHFSKAYFLRYEFISHFCNIKLALIVINHGTFVRKIAISVLQYHDSESDMIPHEIFIAIILKEIRGQLKHECLIVLIAYTYKINV